MTPLPLLRVTFVSPVSTKGGGAISLALTSPKVQSLEYDLDTLTIKIVRDGETERVPNSNVVSMRFVKDYLAPAPKLDVKKSA
jgi:hypothetical protein